MLRWRAATGGWLPPPESTSCPLSEVIAATFRSDITELHKLSTLFCASQAGWKSSSSFCMQLLWKPGFGLDTTLPVGQWRRLPKSLLLGW